MSKEKRENQLRRIAMEAEMEGLGYAIYPGGYIKPDMTDDPELKKHIEQAKESLAFIEKAIDGYM